MLLEVHGLTKSFGGVGAVRDASFDVAEGSITALIGPNGAGKNVVAFKLQALMLGAVLGGLAGLLLAWQIGVFSPDDYQPTLTFYAYLILILGGMNRLWAIPVGAVLFSLLYTGTRFLNFFPLSLFDSGSRAFLRLFLVGLLLVLFMALRPQGLLGSRRQLLLDK